jgi:hypothetical protein
MRRLFTGLAEMLALMAGVSPTFAETHDASFGDTDLSSVIMSTNLAVRGRNNVSDFAGNDKVHRN